MTIDQSEQKGIERRRFLPTSKMAACSKIAKTKQDGVHFNRECISLIMTEKLNTKCSLIHNSMHNQ
jgi:hypothetical protein